MDFLPIAFGSVIVALIVVGFLLLQRRQRVGLGNIGVVIQNGTPTDKILTPGVHIVNFFQEIKQFPVTTVPIGSVGVVFEKFSSSKNKVVSGEVLLAGEHYHISPIHSQVVIVPTTDRLLMVGIKEDLAPKVDQKLKADYTDLALDTEIYNVKVWLPYNLNFRIAPENARQVIERFGDIDTAVKEVVQPRSREIVRRIFRDEIIRQDKKVEELDQIRDEIEGLMSKALSNELASYGITMTYFNLREPNTGELGNIKRQERIDISLSQSKRKTLEEEKLTLTAEEEKKVIVRKQTEDDAVSAARVQQQAKRAELELQELTRAQKEADEVSSNRLQIARAEAEAKADEFLTERKLAARQREITELAKAEVEAETTRFNQRIEYEAKSKIELAKAEAQANHLLAESLKPELVAWLQTQAQMEFMKQWNGQLPMFSSGTSPFVNLSANIVDLLNLNQQPNKPSS